MSEIKIWNTALYLRLSREDEDKNESESIASQQEILFDFIDKNEDLKLYKVYTDYGYTGTNFDRPQFQEMMNDVSLNKVNCIVVKDLSRLGRNHIDTDKYLEMIFPILKVRFIAINDQIDSYLKPKSTSNIMVSVKNLLNDEYCRDISTKVRTVLDMKRERGQYIGSFASYGYLKDPNDHSKLIIDNDAAENVRRIFNMFVSGNTIRSIATTFNIENIPTPSAYKKLIGLNDGHIKGNKKTNWDSQNIKRILTNQMYVGDMVQKKVEILSYKLKKQVAQSKDKFIIVKNTHEPIIQRDIFEKVQDMLNRDTRVCTSSNELDLFSGYCKCGDCRRGMNKKHIHQPYKDYYYYICSTFKKCGKTACSKHAIQTSIVKDTVLNVIRQYANIALNMDRLIDFINISQQNNTHSERLQKQLSEKYKLKNKTESIRNDLYIDLKSGILSQDMYFSLKEKYENDLGNINKEIENIEYCIREIQSGLTKENKFISNFKKYSEIMELDREIVVELIDNIFIYENGRIEIELKFNSDYLIAREYIEINSAIYLHKKQLANLQLSAQTM